MRIVRALTLLLAATAAVPGTAVAEIVLPPVLSNHMVVQRDRPIPVWGTASPGERVTVTFRGQKHETVAAGNCTWRVTLDPLPAGGPDPLVVAGTNTITFDDVLVGEVWLGAGQSNMAGTVNEYMGGDEIIKMAAAEDHPRLRLFVCGRKRWEEAGPEHVKAFSALMFAFGLRLEAELNVPVGLIVGSSGASPSAEWASPKSLAEARRAGAPRRSPDIGSRLEQQLAKQEEAAQARAAKKHLGSPVPVPPDPHHGAGAMFAAQIQPLIPFAIRGVLWDQGESGTGVDGVDQYALMGALIRGWRAEWNQGEFPFLYFQKPSGGGCAWDPTEPTTRKADRFAPQPTALPPMTDGPFREAYLKIMTYPNTAMVTTSDLGPGIHPVNKSGYADRACRVALGMVYAKPVEYYGPVYQSHTVEGNRVRVRFTHVGQGLVGRHAEKVQGFVIAGEDRKFHWADAELDGETVVVSSEKVPKPVAVRYAFWPRFPWANLFNADGLPALSFRTDSW